MAKKKYTFNYDFSIAEVVFMVDLEKFTEEMAQETLDFFSWDYDHDADPIDEAMKKYALEVLRISGDRHASSIVKSWCQEGFAPIDNSFGIELIDFTGFEFDADNLEMEVTNG
jgi:hypothetical protein